MRYIIYIIKPINNQVYNIVNISISIELNKKQYNLLNSSNKLISSKLESKAIQKALPIIKIENKVIYTPFLFKKKFNFSKSLSIILLLFYSNKNNIYTNIKDKF